ncbi:hypothetical protein C477_03574 [Haloterrigena salina JCM 13891]|uniref:Uncharacterized protein n=1 Tax=Haloterrigena salina JCM 13891 TaxID=1227488 RepID=M0CJP3_9EURY|nr:hypothetical protein C477_03574 [Haloterrigena salina JCM 13891]
MLCGTGVELEAWQAAAGTVTSTNRVIGTVSNRDGGVGTDADERAVAEPTSGTAAGTLSSARLTGRRQRPL